MRSRSAIINSLFGALGLAALGVTSAAEGGTEPYPVLATVLSDTFPSKMLINCTPTSASARGRSRITCEFIQTSILLPPSTTQLDADIAKRETEMRADYAKDAKGFFSGCPMFQADPAAFADAGAFDDPKSKIEISFFPRLKEACAKRDASAMIKAFSDMKRATESKTCKMGVTNAFKETLEQLDANTWVGTDGPRGTCNVTVTTTLWRTISGSMSYWSFKQVAVIPENQAATVLCGQTEKVRTTTLKWDGQRHWLANCQLLDM